MTNETTPYDERARSSYNGTAADRRPTVISSTDSVPMGTIISVPSAPTTGPVPQAPVVGATTFPWKRSVIIWLGITTPIWMTVYEYIDSLSEDFHDFSTKRLLRIIIIGGLGLIVAYNKKNSNLLTR